MLFLVVSFIGIVLIIVGTNQKLTTMHAQHKIAYNKQILLLGHSHTQRAYNDNIIKNIKNMSQAGDSYFYSYLKARQLVNSNPQLNSIIIEFTNNKIDSKMDEWIWGDLHLNAKFSKFSGYASWSDYSLLANNNFKGFLNNLNLGTRKNIKTIVNPPANIPELKDWGKFDTLVESFNSITPNLRAINNKEIAKAYKISIANLLYLKKIVKLSKQYKLKLYLIRTPLHKAHHFLNNERLLDSIYKEDFDNIPFLDFKEYPISNNGFKDDSHLNIWGSELLSHELQLLLENGLLQSKEPQKLIDSLIECRKHSQKMHDIRK